MRILQVLRQLSALDFMTITSCLHYCAVLNKEQRKDFQTQYGMKHDNNITSIIQRLRN